MISLIRPEIRYKGLRAGLRSQYNCSEWKLGVWRKTSCTGLCFGFNCSRNIQDIFKFVKVEVVAEVEVRGKHFVADDKETWEEMRVIKAWHWGRRDSIELAIFCAELVLDMWTRHYPDDDRPQKAIWAATACLYNPTQENLKAAKEAEAAAKDAADLAKKATKYLAETGAYVAACAAHAAVAPNVKDALWAASTAILRSTEWEYVRGENKLLIENWLRQRIKILTPYHI